MYILAVARTFELLPDMDALMPVLQLLHVPTASNYTHDMGFTYSFILGFLNLFLEHTVTIFKHEV